MYVTYKGKTYVICREYGSLYDLDDPDGIYETLLGISKWKCSMPRDMYKASSSKTLLLKVLLPSDVSGFGYSLVFRKRTTAMHLADLLTSQKIKSTIEPRELSPGNLKD